MFTPGRPHTDLPSERPPVLLHSLHSLHGVNYRHGSRGALTPCAVCWPGSAQFHRSLLPACLRCLRAKSDAVITPRAADREPLPSRHPRVPLWQAVAAAVRMWSQQRNALHPSESIGEEDEMFFPLSPVPIPPSQHHPVLHLPHRR